jgi:ATP-dependent DNA helicase RecQ
MGEVVVREQPPDAEEIAEEVAERQDAHRQFEHSRVEMMRGYAETYNCRREYLLNYFGEMFEGPCGFCDTCDAGTSQQESKEEKPFALKSKVLHKIWGEGLVMRYEGDKIVVLFDTGGYKTLSLQVVTEKGLLTLVDREGDGG